MLKAKLNQDLVYVLSANLHEMTMMSSSTCEVEISITDMDGEETTEPVPECLQGAVMTNPGDSVPEPEEFVVLPPRFTKMINCTDCEKLGFGDNLLDREKDIHTALKWIRQEIVSSMNAMVLILIRMPIKVLVVHLLCRLITCIIATWYT